MLSWHKSMAIIAAQRHLDAFLDFFKILNNHELSEKQFKLGATRKQWFLEKQDQKIHCIPDQQYLSSRIAHVFGKSITSWIVRTNGSGIDSQGFDVILSLALLLQNNWLKRKEHDIRLKTYRFSWVCSQTSRNAL